ncbi:MAG: dimethyl sulfoxide reductase anchor subunit [Epsilonproteobacteria bacterium]|nr:molybdopterin oxidoreductase [Campylobacterota bacterium]NPA56561.1 dimethyl sulfoxide reductase anchor subunit [Campylobacterota bacterium]
MTAVESFIDYKAQTGLQCGSYSLQLPPLKEGQQYRFHFDATKCIGCHCCEVACNEQNNNPPQIKWRRVGEVEGGEFPHVLQMFLSISCNHCIDPACLKGCPTNAYIKLENGIVIHDDPACIGCQYCTWNCPYDAPIFHEERHIVTKCHMCYDRIEAGQTPACVQACPEGAIEIEVVDVERWLAEDMEKEGNAPYLIDARYTKATTRYTLPEEMPEHLEPMDRDLIRPAHRELPLVVMTLLTQVSLVGFIALFLGDLAAEFTQLPEPSFAMVSLVFALSAIGLPFSALHLGRPIKAVNAMKNLKTSWLSREAVALGAFTALMGVVTLLYYLNIDGPLRLLLEAVTAVVGIYGIYAQSMIYRIPAKPTWNRAVTTYRFFSTGYIGTQILALIATLEGNPQVANILLAISILLGSVHIYLFFESQRFYEMVGEDHEFSYQIGRAQYLLEHTFRKLFHFRKISLPLGAVVLPLFATIALNAGSFGFAFAFQLFGVVLASATEFVGRLLFYATAVKTGMPGNFFAGAQRP